MTSKLERDFDELVGAQVISTEVQNNILEYYDTKKQAEPNKLFAIFGVLGSLLVGLGVILIIAHNWDDFSRGTKTIWAFLPLVIGQIAVAFSYFKRKGKSWVEGSATFLFFGIGASLSLVSQIYNISGSMSSLILTWMLLAAPLIYLLKSYASLLLHLLFATIYACNVGYFNDDIPWLYIPLVLFVLPAYFKNIKIAPSDNSTGMLHWLVPASILISLGAFVSGNDTVGFVMYMALFGLFYNIGHLTYFKSQKMRRNGYLLIGSLGTVITLLIASFRWVWNDGATFGNVTDIYITGFLIASAIGVLIYLFRQKSLKIFNPFQYAFLLFAGIFFFQEFDSMIPMVLTNILLLSMGLYAIYLGSKRNAFSILNYGLLIITSLIAFRFFDIEISFVIRGVLFVAIGVGFFVANYSMFKKQ
ncbi:hypothetical protein ULMS_10450 [Patiriisocius marinistellae]|uniref:DUF2157 domain-containing protein n=1 Tax=Patiriisocius marinistellae TaxID=2494560 RepID=A0A5J4FT31_9FLAO|nr:DUF2157 domain-containing protein [Patiriisocius marinistellae]GEQ85537.1 hypothetical protein ULMS_10450 [Patiriisocius marinistellae]